MSFLAPPNYLTSVGQRIWTVDDPAPAWGFGGVNYDISELSTVRGNPSGKSLHLKPKPNGSSYHADAQKGIVVTSPHVYPLFKTTDTFTLAVYLVSAAGDDTNNANMGGTTPYVDVRFSSAVGKEIGGFFRTARVLNCWQFITAPASLFTINSGGELITNQMTSMYMRAYNNAATGVSEFYVGGMWLNVKSRPKIIIELDDGWSSAYTEAFQYCNPLGVKFSVPTATEAVGADGYLTWSQITEMAAGGIEFTTHSNSNHTTLANYAGVLADTLAHKAALEAHGAGAGARHYVYPQGIFNSAYSFDALRDAGIVTARHTSGGANFQTAFGATTPFMLPAIILNATNGLAGVLTNVTRAIEMGTTLRIYGHKIAATVTDPGLEISRADFRTFIDTVFAYKNQGILDIVTVDEWWRGLLGYDKLPFGGLRFTGRKGFAEIRP